jgi:hypothetical protein
VITTVTTSTITSVTTTIGFAIAVSLVAVIALVVFLCAKELAAASSGSSPRFLARSFDIGIVPLVIAFIMIVAMKVVEIIA